MLIPGLDDGAMFPRMLCGAKEMAKDVEFAYRQHVKPCPFCGKPPVIMATAKGLMIFCSTDECANPSVGYHTHTDTLRVWNQRA
jgi:Restriction alleviation protein Lar